MMKSNCSDCGESALDRAVAPGKVHDGLERQRRFLRQEEIGDHALVAVGGGTANEFSEEVTGRAIFLSVRPELSAPPK